ncbi:DUF4198 domain-containing protein [Sphingobium sp. RAC03]|uniref:DUF4198 domain-containing protein n=1 Tax=Sphingobium sp. RAC03 TaxID=1843368 RepID=UPI00083D3C50|nr:DUF4198 domain-containing protein [Sphingobium sp. RAC03]AOF94921.1 hypothetical protein BSY17_3136 [Sphingobium sp. RAC03]
MKISRFHSAALGLTLFCTTMAQAHMPYMLPTTFDLGAKGDHVTVQAAFAEDAFLPEVAMRDAPFHLVAPDGRDVPTGPVTHLRDLTVFEAAIPADGTYRVTSGQRAGRKGKMFRQGDKWAMRGEGGTLPANVEQVDVQSMTLAEAYVTRGQPTDTTLKPSGRALEIQAITHPNAIVAGSGASFALLFEGKPLPQADISLFRSAGLYDGRKVVAQIKSGTDGRFALTPPDAGTYLILVRHRGAAPAGSETPYRSYTYTLTFDAA